MPVFTQPERIEISKKIVSIPEQNQGAMDTKQSLLKEADRLQKEDNGNKLIFDEYNNLITGYQLELQRYDGNGRTIITEQDLIDSALNKTGNFFYLNRNTVPTPSVPSGVWIYLFPFAGNLAIGRNYQEAFTPVTKESDKIDAINTILMNILTFTEVIRVTGQSCVVGTPDVISDNPTIQQLILDLIVAVEDWKNFIIQTRDGIVLNDSNTSRQDQNNLSIQNANETIMAIDQWLALANFNTGHGQIDCAGFNGFNVYLLTATKLRDDKLLDFTNNIDQRLEFIMDRIVELETNLGFIVQDLSNGSITASMGLYGDRYRALSARIDLINGTLKKFLSITSRIGVLDAVVDSNNSALDLYAPFFKATAFKAPSTGNQNIFVKEPSGFIVGDSIFIVANDQPEIQAEIIEIDENRFVLDKTISVKYTTGNGSRIYKVIP